jgi:hypothetical protein
LLTTAALAALLAYLVPVFINRPEYTAVVSNYIKNPSLDNAAVLAREQFSNRRIAHITHVFVGGVLFVLMNAGWFLFARRHARRDEPLSGVQI